MKLALYGILVILGLFIILMVFNPRLSCFGRKLKSPFYPVYRKKKQQQREIKTVDYGFDLENPGTDRTGRKINPEQVQRNDPQKGKNVATEDYGFDLRGEHREK
jgi:hypothetical protein